LEVSGCELTKITQSSLQRDMFNAKMTSKADDRPSLKDTFPASDPVTIGEPTALVPERPAHRQAPLVDKDLVNELAARVAHRASAMPSWTQVPLEQDHLKTK